MSDPIPPTEPARRPRPRWFLPVVALAVIAAVGLGAWYFAGRGDAAGDKQAAAKDGKGARTPGKGGRFGADPNRIQPVAVAVARTGGQRHSVFCLCRASVLANLTAFLDAGGRKVDTWHAALDVCDVAFDDHVGGLLNINTLEQLHALEH